MKQKTMETGLTDLHLDIKNRRLGLETKENEASEVTAGTSVWTTSRDQGECDAGLSFREAGRDAHDQGRSRTGLPPAVSAVMAEERCRYKRTRGIDVEVTGN